MNIRVQRLTTNVLGGICGALLLLALAQYAGLGRGYGWAADDPASEPQMPGSAIADKPLKLPPESAFAAVDAHPLFNEDRQPTPAEEDDSSGEAEAPQNPLNVSLTGIISTPTVKIAMVQDKARNQSMALKVGMPLEGQQAGWTLVEVKPRSVVFRSAANERTEVELETAVATMPRAPPRSSRSHVPTRNAARPANNAGDLAKRIEERRRQMREDAERLRKEGGRSRPPPQPPRKPTAPPKK